METDGTISKELNVGQRRHDIHNNHIPEDRGIHPLEQIQNSVQHKLTLELWEREEGVLNRRIEQKEARRMSIQNEIYQLLGLNFVFQGVVLTALFQAGDHSCRHWWSPFSLTVIAFVATMGAVLHKFQEQSLIESQLEEEKIDCRVLFMNIHSLRIKGTLFPLSEPFPPRPRQFKASPFSMYFWRRRCYRSAVLFTLFAFAVIISVSCNRILCK